MPGHDAQPTIELMPVRSERTEDVLDMVWTDDEGQNIRKGVYAYAFFTSAAKQSPPFPFDAWPHGTRANPSRLADMDQYDYVVYEWTILPSRWPRRELWCRTLESTLRALSGEDAVVAWCGLLGGGFALPPELFDPDEMTDEVYAAMLPGRFVCSARLGKLYTPLSRSEMIEFREATIWRKNRG